MRHKHRAATRLPKEDEALHSPKNHGVATSAKVVSSIPYDFCRATSTTILSGVWLKDLLIGRILRKKRSLNNIHKINKSQSQDSLTKTLYLSRKFALIVKISSLVRVVTSDADGNKKKYIDFFKLNYKSLISSAYS